MDKIRVAFFADMLKEKMDGYSRTIQKLLQHIPQQDFEFVFITGTKPEGAATFYDYIYVPSISIPTNKNYKMALPVLAKRRLIQALDIYQPDVIHIANPSLLGKFACEYAANKHIPSVSIYHTHYVSYVKYYLRNIPSLIPYGEKYISNVNKEIYDKCDIVYVPAMDITHSLSMRGFNTAHYKLWQRGIDTQMFNVNKKDINYIRNLVGNKKKNIFFASRLVWEKNLSTLIEVYQKLQLDQYNLIIAGSGVAESELRSKMPQAYFLGNLSHADLSIVYASCDVFLFPSDTESFGNVVLEAMASGLPVVAANSGGPVGIIREGETGFLCASHTASEYVDCIDLLMSNRDMRHRIIDKGLAHVNNFSWKTLSDIYFNDLRTLANSKNVQYA